MRLIDADALKDSIKIGDMPALTEGLKGWIDKQPTIDPVKHGKWKAFDLTWGRSIYACTACGDAMEVPTENGEPMFHYCPWCGARMDGEE